MVGLVCVLIAEPLPKFQRYVTPGRVPFELVYWFITVWFVNVTVNGTDPVTELVKFEIMNGRDDVTTLQFSL